MVWLSVYLNTTKIQSGERRKSHLFVVLKLLLTSSKIENYKVCCELSKTKMTQEENDGSRAPIFK